MSKVKEIGRLMLRSQLKNNESPEGGNLYYPDARAVQQQSGSKFWKKPWFSTLLAVAYILSPIDLMPDIPVVGFLDDLFLGVVIGLNWAQYSTEESHKLLSDVIGLIKWVLIILGVILILLLAIFGLLVVRLFQ